MAAWTTASVLASLILVSHDDRVEPRSVEWLYRRLQADGRAQRRYLLLLLLASTYAIAVHYTDHPTVSVSALGIDVPRQLAEAGAASVIGVLVIALLGAFSGIQRTYCRLLSVCGKGVDWNVVDANPIVLDFLAYATQTRRGHRIPLLATFAALLYPLPILASLIVGYVLLVGGYRAPSFDPPWIQYVLAFNAVLITAATLLTLPFLWLRLVRMAYNALLDLQIVLPSDWNWLERWSSHLKARIDQQVGCSGASPI